MAALKNQGIVVTHSSKWRGYHGCKRLILVCIVHPHICANSLCLCLTVVIGPKRVFFPGKIRKPTFIQAHFTPAVSCWGGWFSCRQIIHGDFFLNEVKLLLSAKRGFQKSQPGLQLLPFFALPPFVSQCGGVTRSQTWQALNGKRKSALSGDIKLQGSFNYCELFFLAVQFCPVAVPPFIFPWIFFFSSVIFTEEIILGYVNGYSNVDRQVADKPNI